MPLPNNQIFDAAARSAHSVRSAVPYEHPMDAFVRPELPSPAPSYFPPRSESAPTSPSRIAPSVTLSIPSPDARPPSTVFLTSSQTLGGRESLHSLTTEDHTVLGGPLNAESPEPIVAGLNPPTEHAASAVPTPRRRVYMAPSPVNFFTEGERSRYWRRPVYVLI